MEVICYDESFDILTPEQIEELREINQRSNK